MTPALNVLRKAVAALRGQAASPTAIVKSATVRITNALNSARSRGPAGAPLAMDELRRVHGEARRVADEIFDLEQMARGILARHWTGLTVRQQGDFRRFVTEFLARSCVAYLRDRRRAAALQIGETAEGNFATVTWRVSTTRTPALLVYRLVLKAGRWKIYDVLLNGESFIGTCRSQFDRPSAPSLDPASLAAALAEAIRTWGRAAGVELNSISL